MANVPGIRCDMAMLMLPYYFMKAVVLYALRKHPIQLGGARYHVVAIDPGGTVGWAHFVMNIAPEDSYWPPGPPPKPKEPEPEEKEGEKK